MAASTGLLCWPADAVLRPGALARSGPLGGFFAELDRADQELGDVDDFEEIGRAHV